ncbi:MAG: hypothetical protein HQL87_13750 [Magnetococcales bacterium]|nr:hypothetical protein [Magnetococcales bacterium]
MRYLFMLGLFVLTCFASQGQAGTRVEVPEPLQPWVGWVLHGHKEAQCPMVYNDAAQHICQWPSRLTLVLDSSSGRFQQSWQVAQAAWVPLPGSSERWPDAVQVDDKPAVVIAHGQTPGVWLAVGNHAVTGVLHYPTLPDFLDVPPNSGLVALSVAGRKVPFAVPDAQGRLWLHPPTTEKPVEDQLDMTVHRLIQDGVPLTLETRLELRISGKKREILLDQPLDEGWIPLRLDASLPVQWEADGRLRVHARPGVWKVILTQRQAGPVAQLGLPKERSWPWPEEEVWSFAANPQVRMVSVTGVDAVDPQQTQLPQEWRNYPAFRVRPGEQLHLVEKKRGDVDPVPDRLSLARTLWLDFSGQGWTIQDHLQGSSVRAWRLEMPPPMELGRVAIDNDTQLITHLPDATQGGVEIRKGQVNLVAESRLPMAGGVLPATGWNQDLQKVSATLQLPLGWRLLHATGADTVQNTWIGRWTLLDLFLVLVIALAVSRLWGRGWGGLALLTLGLAYPEGAFLAWSLLAVLAGCALQRVVVGSGLLARGVRLWRGVAVLTLVLLALPFLVEQIRQGLYPQLALPQYIVSTENMARMDAPAASAAAPTPAKNLRSLPKMASAPLSAARRKEEMHAEAMPRPAKLVQMDPQAQVQTGPGVPQWQWQAVAIHWNGPVEQGQELHLYLLPPWANQLLTALRVVLLLILLGRVAEFNRLGPLVTGRQAPGILAVLILLTGLGLSCLPGDAAADTPTTELLETLKERLLEPPTCLPACADLARLRLEADSERVRLHLEVHALQETAIPLPGNAAHWLPQEVILDGKPASHLRRIDQPETPGTLWLWIPSGIHTVLLEGVLPAQEMVQIPLPMPPRWAVADSKIWQVEGMHDNGVTDTSLQLRRIQAKAPADGTDSVDAPAAVLPPFLEVERRLILGLTWEIETHIHRVTQPGSAVQVEFPLLPGESITTADVRVVNGTAQAHLEPEQMDLHWHSTLKVTEAIHLQAPKVDTWNEVWRLQVSPIWHVTLEGVPVLRHLDDQGLHQPEWRPWAGEQVVIHISRPQGVDGPSLTLEKSEMQVTPGERSADVSLTLHLRSSRGGQHILRLPEKAVLLTTRIGDQELALRQEGRQLVLPITPGWQEIHLLWRQPDGLGQVYATPQLDLGISGVNGILQLHIPPQRWILWTWGPAMGPAVLYWGTLLLILLVAIGLGRVAWLPVRTYQWVLLGVGLSTVDMVAAVTLVSWFLFLGWRGIHAELASRWRFNTRQVVGVLWTLAALLALGQILQHGLLGYPDMQIAGNQSSQTLLQWFQDRTGTEPPVGHLLSLPIIAYRLLMLVWSLWLATALLGWIRWGWSCFVTGGVWQHKQPASSPPPPPPPPGKNES